MHLDEINAESCPYCGAVTVAESKEHQHTNGHWNEFRKFSCGHSLEFSPNFMIIRELSPCPNTSEHKEKEALRTKAQKDLETYIKNLKVDENFKKNILNRIQHL